MTDEEYEQHIHKLARVLQDFLEQHPEDVDAPVDNIYDWESFRREHDMRQDAGVLIPLMDQYCTGRGLLDRIASKDPTRRAELSALTMTGYQWGVAFNLAHLALGIDNPAPNPALIEL